MIVVTMIVILAIVLLVTLNPWTQINKGHDSKRKQELIQLSKTLEDYYNDKQCYPKPNEVCYNSSAGVTCNICGNETTSPSFSPYLTRLPCDPRQPLKKYLYQVDNSSCPTWYRIYTTLATQSDPIITSVGCQNGCGPSPDFSYNYGVSSPNIGLERNTSMDCSNYPSLYIVFEGICNICGNYQQCRANYPNSSYYIDSGGGGASGCTTACIKEVLWNSLW